MDTDDALLQEFADLVGVERDNAVELLKASAAALLGPVVEAGPGAQRLYLLPIIEAAAVEPSVETVAAAAATITSGFDAVKALRAAAQVFLNQAQRDTARGLTAESSVAAEVRRAAHLNADVQRDTDVQRDPGPSSERSLGSEVLGSHVRFNRIGGSFSTRFGSDSFAPRGPHGSGGGPDD